MNWGSNPNETNAIEKHKYRIEEKPRESKQKDTETIYDKLIDIILEAKKDIKFHRSCETIDDATRYARTKGLRAREHDLNGDGITDVIIYNSAGKPIMVNGYSIAPSEFPYRKEYLNKNPKPADRLKTGGYRQWKQDEIWGVKDDFDDDGNRKVKYDNRDLPPSVSKYYDYGYAKLSAPKRKQSAHQMINKYIADVLKEFISNTMPDNEKTLNALLPRFKIYSLANDCVIGLQIAKYFDTDVSNLANTPKDRYNVLKQIIKQHQKQINETIFDKSKRQLIFDNSYDNLTVFFGNVIDMLANNVLQRALPSDIEIEDRKKKDEIGTKALMLTTKEQFSNAIDTLKPQIIESIFSEDNLNTKQHEEA